MLKQGKVHDQRGRMSTKDKRLLTELEAVCEQLDIKIRYERTKAKGGLCTFEEKQMIIIDKFATVHFKVNMIVSILSKFDLTDMHIKPRIRELIENDKN